MNAKVWKYDIEDGQNKLVDLSVTPFKYNIVFTYGLQKVYLLEGVESIEKSGQDGKYITLINAVEYKGYFTYGIMEDEEGGTKSVSILESDTFSKVFLIENSSIIIEYLERPKEIYLVI